MILQPAGRVKFDPPLNVRNSEVLSVQMKLTDAGIELVDAQVLTPEQQAKKLRDKVIETVKIAKLFSGGVRVCDLSDYMTRAGCVFTAAELNDAVFSLVAIKAIDISTDNVLTIHKREE